MAIPIASDIPMAGGLGRGGPEQLPAIPMGIPMANGPGRGKSMNEPGASYRYSIIVQISRTNRTNNGL